jgi:DNA-3-methyladenine glycosylase II
MWQDAEEFLLKDKYIGPLVKKYGVCTLKPRPKKYYFEDLVDAIVQQQLSMKAAAAIFNRVKQKIASKADSSKQSKHKWRVEKTIKVNVTPEKILLLSDPDLRECGLSRPKVLYVRDLAQKVKGNEVEIHKMAKLSDEKIIEELIKVKGIGVWTAHMFLIITLCRPDIFNVGDLGLRNAFKNVIKNINTKKMEKFAFRWKPYRTLASWYLWRSLEKA